MSFFLHKKPLVAGFAGWENDYQILNWWIGDARPTATKRAGRSKPISAPPERRRTFHDAAEATLAQLLMQDIVPDHLRAWASLFSASLRDWVYFGTRFWDGVQENQKCPVRKPLGLRVGFVLFLGWGAPLFGWLSREIKRKPIRICRAGFEKHPF